MSEQNKPNATDPNDRANGGGDGGNGGEGGQGGEGGNGGNGDGQPNPNPNPAGGEGGNGGNGGGEGGQGHGGTQNATEADRTARLEEKLAMREARDVVVEILRTKSGVPDATAKRLTETLPARFVLNDARELDVEVFKKLAESAIDGELAYLNEVAPSGRVVGMGSSTTTAISESDAKKNQERIDKGLAALSGRPANAAANGKSE